MKTLAKNVALAFVMTTGIVVGGCSSLAIHVQGLGDICQQHVRVDIAGVNWMERKQWEDVAMQEYWASDNKRRKESLEQHYNQSVTFEPKKLCEVLIKETDPVWKTWKNNGATHFFVMFDTCTDARAWRVCLPLQPKYWRGRTNNGRIEVYLQPSGVIVKTPPKPGWQ